MFDMLKDKFSGDEGNARLYGLGLLASQLGSGQAPDARPAFKMLEERKQRNALKDQMNDGQFMDMFSDQERAYLSTLPPQAAQSLIGQRIFAEPAAPVAGVEIKGRLVNPQTGDIIGDYRDPEGAEPGYSLLTPEEVSAAGLNPSLTYQRSGDGQIKPVDGSGAQTGYIATGESAAAIGLDPAKSYNISSGPEGMKATEIGNSSTNVTVNQGGETAFSEETGKLIAREAADIAAAGGSASRSLVQIDALEGALGQSGGASTAFTAMASNLGLKLDGASDVEAAQAIISQLVPQQRPLGSGPMSDADLELFKQSLPRLINTPEGNAQIISTMRRIAEYDVQRGDIARRLQIGEVDQQGAFAEYAALQNPLVATPQGGLQGSPLSASEQRWLEGTQ